MTIRFLQTTPSGRAGFPFQPGQTIELAGLTPEVRAWIRDGFAIVVPAPAERAIAPEAPETAIVEERAARKRR